MDEDDALVLDDAAMGRLLDDIKGPVILLGGDVIEGPVDHSNIDLDELLRDGERLLPLRRLRYFGLLFGMPGDPHG